MITMFRWSGECCLTSGCRPLPPLSTTMACGVKAYRRFLAQAKVLQDAFAASDKIVPYDPKNIRGRRLQRHALGGKRRGAGGKLERIPEFRELGVRILSLTWNKENELAGGADSETGLTALGKKAVKELEANRIVIDVSHLNNASFWELCEIAERPFHCHSLQLLDICPHKRNLDDLQIQEIIRRKGLIGINFYPIFINGESARHFSGTSLSYPSHHCPGRRRCDRGGKRLRRSGCTFTPQPHRKGAGLAQKPQ